VVAAFEALAAQPKRSREVWQEEVRALELDEAVRRSVEKRRSNLLDYQQATEEVGFKGTMTLAGCGLLWGVLVLLIVSRWVPALGWLILPLLLVFIVLQGLRYAIPRERPAAEADPAEEGADPAVLAAALPATGIVKRDEGIRS
jgi:hypothetical protein